MRKLYDRDLEFVKARGPRWAVVGSVRPGERLGEYADDAESAEVEAARYREAGYYQVRVWPPAGSVDLASLGHARAEAKRAYDEATSMVRAGVLRALEEGRSETEVAASAGVDRMTVRAWAGKGQARAE